MRTAITTRSHLEAMAFAKPGLLIELTSEAAFLTTGGTTWCAPFGDQS